MSPEAVLATSPDHILTRETGAAPLIAPVESGERISSVDVLRGVALLGILLMNIVDFGLPGVAYSDPTVAGGDKGPNLAAWFVNQVLFEGKMRALFSMLFGAGVIILTSRAEERGAGASVADIYYRRTLWLVVFGLLHAYFIWGGDILYFYGVVGLMLYPLRKATPKALLIAGLLLLAVIPLKSVRETRRLQAMRDKAVAADRVAAAGRPLTDEQRDAQRAWTEELKKAKPDPEEIKKEIADHQSYWKLFMRRQYEVVRSESIFFYRFGVYDIAGMMLIGMALMKLGVFAALRSPRWYAALALCGYGLGAPLNAWVGGRLIASHFEPVTSTLSYTAYDLGRLLVALGHVGLLMLIVKAGVLRWLTARLAAVGQMALTNYLTHGIVCTLVFNGYGFGLFGKLERYQLLYVVLAIWIFQLIISPVWLRHFRFGPAEWVWRSLTYWQRQPMRLDASSPAAETLAVSPQETG
ncbi:MAG TPA: DUF418 domain-containing protein [Blastocatellia bacterium]|nr:DUF418 domain-containing protein [Blastocatellia bacterium]